MWEKGIYEWYWLIIIVNGKIINSNIVNWNQIYCYIYSYKYIYMYN